jgi:hypothetical protein
MQVVDYIIDNDYYYNCSIIIHSFNIPRSIEMKKRLDSAGYYSIYQPGAWNLINI